jgi:hypothetical protein
MSNVTGNLLKMRDLCSTVRHIRRGDRMGDMTVYAWLAAGFFHFNFII